MTMHHISELIPTWLDDLQKKAERFNGMPQSQIDDITISEAVGKFMDWEVAASRNSYMSRKERFLSWFDTNYPWLYDKHAESVWLRVQRGRY